MPDKPVDLLAEASEARGSAEQPQPFILVCRSIANFGGQRRPPGDVTRECGSCHSPVSLTQRGQEGERAGGAIILCNPCALAMLARLKAAGGQAEFRMNPEAAKAIENSQAARNTYDLFGEVFKP